MSELSNTFQQIAPALTGYLPSMLGALAILVVGWIMALGVSRGVRTALHRTDVDQRVTTWVLGEESGRKIEVVRIAGSIVYYVVLTFALVGVLQVLQLSPVSEPLNAFLGVTFAFLPRLVSAGVLLLVAWLTGRALRFLTARAVRATGIDRRVGQQVGARGESVPLAKTLSETVYWLVMLMFVPAILHALALQGILGPLQAMLNTALGYLPNLVGGGLVLAVGWFVARLLQRIVANLSRNAGLDRMGERLGLATKETRPALSHALGTVVFALILLPTAIGALNALQLDAVAVPASAMLEGFLGAVPFIFGAALVVGVAFVVGRFVAQLVESLLSNAGFDSLADKLGFKMRPPAAGARSRTPSQMAGVLTMVALLLLGAVSALRMMGFVLIADLVRDFTVFGAQVLLGLAIFGLGLLAANGVGSFVEASRASHKHFFSLVSRIAVLVFAGAMALRQMGIADDIINIAFALLMGAVAVAFALAFGLGGRAFAGQQLEEWRRNLKGEPQPLTKTTSEETGVHRTMP